MELQIPSSDNIQHIITSLTEQKGSMPYADWKITGDKIDLCNCNYGCPCQFYAPPTYEKCEGVSVYQIETGHFGDTRLDGLRIATLAGWPGSIHEGEGIGQVVIDETADEAQREAIFKIVSGEEQEPTTAFSIYASTMRDDYATLYRPIDMRYDTEARTASVDVPGVIKVEVEPIRNSVTGEAHRAQVSLPNGFEFNESEMASGTFSATGDIEFDYENRTAIFARFSFGPQGIAN